MPKKKTHEEFIRELKCIQPNIRVLNEYTTSSKKVKCKCLICDNKWDARASNLLLGHGCPECNKKSKKSHETFIKELYLINEDIEIIDKYIDSKTKVKCKCKIDGYEWSSRPDRLLSGNGCPKCSVNRRCVSLQKTNDEFITQLKKINENIHPLENYINSKTKIRCKCLIDGYEWDARPDQLLQGHGCPKCSGKIKKDHDEFVKELKKINPNITILGEYKNTHTKIKCKCNIDNYEWEAKPNSLLNNHGCPKCAGNVKKTHEEFIFQLNKINPYIELLDTYKNSETKIKCRCKVDGYEWYATPSSLLSGKGCKKCAGTLKKTNEEFKDVMKTFHPNIKYEGVYENSESSIDCECLIDGYKWTTTAHSLMRGHGCKKCAGTLKKTHDEFIKEASEKNKKITIIGKYEGTKNKILCQCNKCKNKWYTYPSLVLYDIGCPICTISKGESKIIEKLNASNIDYVSQKTFENCSYKNLLRFDFYIPSKNICIEYQGKQHYLPIDFAGKGEDWAKELFKENQEKDKIKRNFCKASKIRLLEIPYWNFDNIEEILSRELGLAA